MKKNSNPPKTTLHFLESREMGCRISSKDTAEMLASRTKELHATNFFLAHTPGMPVTDCDFIRTGLTNGHILGVWHGYQFPGIVYQLKVNFRPNCSSDDSPSLVRNLEKVGPYCTSFSVVDGCFYKMRQTTRDCVVYVTQHSEEDKRVIVFCILGNDTEVDLQYLINSKIFSCAYNPAKERFVAGSTEKLYIFDSLQYAGHQTIPAVPKALEFSKSGDVIYMSDSGGLQFYDMRTPQETCNNTVIVPGAVTEFKLLADENSIVLNNLEKVIKVDLRTRKTVLTYQGPKHAVSKIPFSLDENTDILCSTSLSNVTRLWSLSTGDILHTLKPYVSQTNACSCLLSNGNQWGVALFQKNWAYILEP